jgi:ABC-type amino acid transport substrate-binding protein
MFIKKKIRLLKLVVLGYFFLLNTISGSGDTLIVAYTNGPPFVYASEIGLQGIGAWLWEDIARELDIAYIYKEMPFSEILQSLEDGTVDVNINGLTVTSAREELFDFSFPYYVSNSTVVTKTNSFSREFKEFMSPVFSFEFLSGFLLLILIIFVFGLIVWIVESKKNEQFRKGFKGVWDGIWWSAVTVTTVGYGDKAPKTSLGKIFGLLWMFIALIFISSLTASLTSNFTETRATNRLENFGEFKEKKVGTVANSGTASFLKKHFFKNVSYYDDLPSGLVALDNEEIYAITYDEPIIRYRLKTDFKDWDFEIKPIRFDQQLYAFGLTKSRKSLKDSISRLIIKKTETIDWEILLNEFDLQLTQ